MKFNQALNNFTGGEWSPKMIGRTDTEQYFKAAKKLLNAIPIVQGGAFKRPGFLGQDLGYEFTTTTGDSTASETLTAQDVLDNVLAADGKVRTFPFHLSDGRRMILCVTDGLPAGHSNSWFLWEPHADNSGVAYPIVNYHDANFSTNVDTLQVQQIGDTLFLVNAGEPIRYLQFKEFLLYSIILPTFSNCWALFQLEDAYESSPWITYPYKDAIALGIGGPNITVSGTLSINATITLVASSDIFTADMLPANNYGRGKIFRFTSSGSTGAARIKTVTDAQNATATVIWTIPAATTYGTTSGTSWDMSAWGGGDGWPAVCAAYQGRLYVARTAQMTDTFWATRIGNVFWFQERPFAQDASFSTYTQDNSRAWTATPNSPEVSSILELSSSKILVAHTNMSEIAMYGSNGALGPLDVNLESSTSYGAEAVKPVRVNNFLTFVQRGGRKIRDVVFSFDESQYKSTDLGQAADHFTVRDPIKEMIPAEIGTSCVFIRTDSKKLLSVTLDRDTQIAAWAGHSLGGVGPDDGEPLVEALAALTGVPGIGSLDSVFCIVRRSFGGTEKLVLERMDYFYEDQDTLVKESVMPVYMDFATYNSQSKNGFPSASKYYFTYSTNDFLVGETLDVMADNIYVGQLEVKSDGGGMYIDLPFVADQVLMGYGYLMRVTPMPIEQGAKFGAPTGLTKRVTDFFIQFFNTNDCKFGRYGTNEVYPISFRADTVGNDEPTPLFTGGKYQKFPNGYSRDYVIDFWSDTPYPCNIVGVAVGGMTHD